VIAVALVACSDSTGPDQNELAGSYTLLTIDGASLPVVVDQVGEDKAEVTMGTVTLDEDGTFGDATELRITEAGGQLRLTQLFQGFTLVYEKASPLADRR
jgi:hypothetical protein